MLASFVFIFAFCESPRAGTGTLTAQAAVDVFCTVGTTALDFGAYDPILTNATTNLNNGTSGTVTIACVKGTSATIALGNGAHYSGTQRQMQHATHPASLLAYELYEPPNSQAGTACIFPGTLIWNSTNVLTPPTAPSKNSRTFNVCGTVRAGQDAEAGTYSDTVVVTVTF